MTKPDAAPTLADLQDALAAFARERDWEQFHNPKNLAMALAAEAGELLEVFQWLNAEDAAAPDDKVLQRAAEELADVMNYALRMCTMLQLDPATICADKLRQNAEKYPVALSRGTSVKYTELGQEPSD